MIDRPKVRYSVNGSGEVQKSEDWPPQGVTISELYLSGETSGMMNSLNDGSLTADAPSGDDASTSWTYPEPKWIAAVTTWNEDGTPDHFARVLTYTSVPFETERESTGQAVLHLFASSDQPDLDVMVKLSLVPGDKGDGPGFAKIIQGWLLASHRAGDPDLTTEMRPLHRHGGGDPIAAGAVTGLRVKRLPFAVRVRPGDRARVSAIGAGLAAARPAGSALAVRVGRALGGPRRRRRRTAAA